jgi:hypothetical protein
MRSGSSNSPINPKISGLAALDQDYYLMCLCAWAGLAKQSEYLKVISLELFKTIVALLTENDEGNPKLVFWSQNFIELHIKLFNDRTFA